MPLGVDEETVLPVLAPGRTLVDVREVDPCALEEVLSALPTGSQAARAAIDLALHDRWGKALGQPLYRLFGLTPDNLPLTSFTIAMDEPEVMAERAKASGLPIIKIKLGGADDEAMVRAIRSATAAKLRVDANAGWSADEAIAEIAMFSGQKPADDPAAFSAREVQANLQGRVVRPPAG